MIPPSHASLRPADLSSLRGHYFRGMDAMRQILRTNHHYIAAAAEGLIGFYDRGELLLLGVNQDHLRFLEVSLGQQHFHVFSASILE